MCPYDEDEDELHDSDEEESGPMALGNWLVETFGGDERFDSVEIIEPGFAEDETLRVKFTINESAHLMVGIFDDDHLIRVGLATDDEDISNGIEAAGEDAGLSLTEFLADSLGTDELEHEVTHVHDDAFYFYSELTYRREKDLIGDALHDEIVYYLEGYAGAFIDLLEIEEE